MEDHRIIGRKMNLFHFQEESQGSVFWHHNGYVLYRLIENYIREKISEQDYIEVKSPQLVDKKLWEKSGHWSKFKENMFIVKDEDKELAIKPMNCPCHIEIFKQGIVSYKELPIRMSEFGSCHRNENSGSLNGLFRLRSFVQDDAHIFCMKEQIVEEAEKFCKLLIDVYSEFGFKEVEVKLSDRPEKRIGSDELWDLAESSLKEASKNLKWELNKGEGAFYGPKLEFILKDSLGREWQCGTLQLDFNLPVRLDAFYVNQEGEKENPVMIHRAILGSMERFIGILLENSDGWLPFWLAPEQIVIAGISNEQDEYCKEIYDILKKKYRVKLDIRSEKINSKIAELYERKAQYLIVIGKREVNENKVSIKNLKDNSQISIDKKDLIEFKF